VDDIVVLATVDRCDTLLEKWPTLKFIMLGPTYHCGAWV